MRYENGDSKKELLARSRYLLFKSSEKMDPPAQKQRAKILLRNIRNWDRRMDYVIHSE